MLMQFFHSCNLTFYNGLSTVNNNKKSVFNSAQGQWDENKYLLNTYVKHCNVNEMKVSCADCMGTQY